MNNEEKICCKCGTSVPINYQFCAKCGTRFDIASISDKSQQLTGVETEKKKTDNILINSFSDKEEAAVTEGKLSNKFIIVGGMSLALVIIAIIVLLIPKKESTPDFETIYNAYCKEEWSELASDGSYLCIDTNPDDKEEMFEMEAYNAIADINEVLGLSKAVYKRMGETSSNDGRQEASSDEFIVTWKYHPDYGMEVTYEKK